MRNRVLSGFALAVWIITTCTTAALAATIYVGPEEIYTTIQDGIYAASHGDSIIVRDGVYPGEINFDGKAIRVQSENGPQSCIIDGGGIKRGIKFATGEGATSILSGFTIKSTRNGRGAAIICHYASPTISNCVITENVGRLGGGVYCYSSSPTISNCAIIGNKTRSYGGGIFCENGSSPTISRCTIAQNTSPYYGGGIYCYNGSSPVVVDCAISQNRGGGIYCCYNSSASFINCGILNNQARYNGSAVACDFASPKLTNCTIVGNRTQTEGAGVYAWSSAFPTFVNCILWGNSPSEVFYDASSEVKATYSDIRSATTHPGAGNINADPLFVDAASGDYHLTLGSPCVDSGTASGAPKSDLEGDPRPQGDGFDMGVDELVP